MARVSTSAYLPDSPGLRKPQDAIDPVDDAETDPTRLGRGFRRLLQHAILHDRYARLVCAMGTKKRFGR